MDLQNIIEQTIKQALRSAEKTVDTNPSEKEIKAGNYKKGHINILGFDITIENPKGSYRSGKDRDGKEWKTKMYNTYGYFKNSVGYDGDHVDVFLGNNLESNKIFGIDQFIKGKFDETKFMMGFDSEEEAKKAYLSNYDKDWKGFKYIRETDVETFKKWLYRGKKQRLPFHDYVTLSESILNELSIGRVLLSHFTDALNNPKLFNEPNWIQKHKEIQDNHGDNFNITKINSEILNKLIPQYTSKNPELMSNMGIENAINLLTKNKYRSDQAVNLTKELLSLHNELKENPELINNGNFMDRYNHLKKLYGNRVNLDKPYKKSDRRDTNGNLINNKEDIPLQKKPIETKSNINKKSLKQEPLVIGWEMIESKETNIIRINNRGSWLEDFCEKIKKYTDKFEILYDCAYDKHNKTGQKYGIESKEYPGIGQFDYVMIYSDVSVEDKEKYKYLRNDGEYEITCRGIKTKEILKDILKRLGQNGNSGHTFAFKIKSLNGNKEDTLQYDGDGHDFVELLDDKKNETINESTENIEQEESKKMIKNYFGIQLMDDWDKLRLGGGGSGVAYLTLDGYVLKLTTSPNEFRTAQRMKGKTFKHLVNVYNVLDFEQENIPPYGYWKKGKWVRCFYGILEEYVDSNLQYNQFMHKYIMDVLFNDNIMNGIVGTKASHNNRYIMLEYLISEENVNTIISRIESYDKFNEDQKNVYIDATQQLHEAVLEMESVPGLELDSFLGGSNFGFDDNGVIKAFDLEGIMTENTLYERDMRFYNDNNEEMDITDYLDTSSEMKIDTAINIINTKLRQPQARHQVLKYILKNINKSNMSGQMKMDLRDQVMEDLSNKVTKLIIPTMFKDGEQQRVDVDTHLEDLNEENKRLLSHKFQIPTELFQTLSNRFNKIKGNQNFTSRDGYKRLQNLVNSNGEIGYLWMNRLKNFWKYFDGDADNDIEAWLNGGGEMRDWVNKALDEAEKSLEMSKMTSKDAGIKNAFIQHHYKNNNQINVNSDAVSFGKVKNNMGESLVYWHVDGDASPDSDSYEIGPEEPITIKNVVEQIIKNI